MKSFLTVKMEVWAQWADILTGSAHFSVWIGGIADALAAVSVAQEVFVAPILAVFEALVFAACVFDVLGKDHSF